MGRSARSLPAGRAASPAGQQKEAAMAAAHYPGGLRPHPPGLRPGPRPSSEMPGTVTTGAAAGGYLLAGRVTGATEPPPRSRAPPASQAMTLRVTLAQPGEPAAQSRGARRGDTQPWRCLAGRSPGISGGQLDRCSIKQKRKMIRPAVPSGDGTVEDNGHPDESIWGESSLHQTRGAPGRLITKREALDVLAGVDAPRDVLADIHQRRYGAERPISIRWRIKRGYLARAFVRAGIDQILSREQER
jgi:hypothetical protein